MENYAELQSQAKTYAQQQLKKYSGPIAAQQIQNMQSMAEFLYQKKECRLAVDLQRKSIQYSRQSNSTAWYFHSLYSACDDNYSEAAKAIYLAYEKETDSAQKIEYLEMMSDYLYSYNRNRVSWSNDLIKLYKQLQVSATDGLTNTEFSQKIKQLSSFQKTSTQLRISPPKIEAYQQQLKICLALNLDDYWSDKEYRFEDYFRFQPKLRASYEKNYGQVCILGADWSQEYNIQVLKGLEVEDKVLRQTRDFSVKTPVRDSSYWFKRSRYLMSNAGISQVPLYAVNTEKVYLSLYHIIEGNLQNQAILSNFQNKLSADDINDIVNSLGNKVWSSDVELNQQLNQSVISQIPLPSEKIQTNGIYVLIAADSKKAMEEAYYYERFASQWIVVSDIGLASYKADDGMTILSHGLNNGQNLADVSLSLLSKNNTTLAESKTDKQGKAFFAREYLSGKDGMQAVSLVGRHPDHGFVYFPLAEAAYDLSDRGVSGRLSPGPMEAFLFTERGIYRPGDSVNMTALLRDRKARAIEGLPLTLKITNPDGIVVREEVIQSQAMGAYSYRLLSSPNGRTGRWKMELFADVKKNSLGEVSFLIEEIIPPRLEVSIQTDFGPITRLLGKDVTIQADYLYGAPGADLNTRLDVDFEIIRQPFANYPDFYFGQTGGPEKNKQLAKQSFNFSREAKTDNVGGAVITVQLPDDLDISNPIQAKLRAEVEDVDGRAMAASKILAVRHLPLYIGLSPQFKERAPEQQAFKFKLITLNEQLEQVKRTGLEWRLTKEKQYFQWFYKADQWAYEKIVEEKPVQEGNITSIGGPLSELEFSLAQGDYRLEVFDQKLKLTSDYRFSVGEQVRSDADSPDVVKLTLDKGAYQSGDVARLSIEAPYSGLADIVIANNKVLDIIQVELSEKNGQVELPVKSEWGTGVYAVLSVYRSTIANFDMANSEKSGKQLAQRAIGVAWLSMDKTPYQLGVEIQAPKKILPRQQLQVPVKVSGVQLGQEVFVTLAAVDSGVLNLTAYESPDPLQFFLGKRKLEVALKDNYSRLIDTISGKPGRLRQGGDSPGHSAAPAKNIKILSRFSGITKIDSRGQAIIPLDIPEFNGRVRLMATAWNRTQLGAASKAMTVADKVVLLPSLPRFLAHGDESTVTVLVQNLNGPEGNYQLQLEGDKKLQLLSASNQRFALKPGQRQVVTFQLQAKQIGNGFLTLKLLGPGNYINQQHLNIGVRGLNLPISQEKLQSLEAGQETFIANQDMLDFYPNSVQKTVTLSSGLNMNVPALLAKLDRYPHGCLEQLSSRLTPLLDLETLSQRWGYHLNESESEKDSELNIRIERTLNEILDKQRYDGSFGLWSAQDNSEYWLTPYVLELLLKAREKNHPVPEFFIKRGMGWLKQFIDNTSYEDKGRFASLAYAHYVLAQVGEGKVEEARYFAKQYASQLPSLLAYAQLLEALDLMGEGQLAEQLLSTVSPLDYQRQIKWRDYGSRLRDMAGFAAIIGHSNSLRLEKYQNALQWITQVLQSSKPQNQDIRYLSTQEQAWLIRLAVTLGDNKTLDIELDGQKLNSQGKSNLALIYDLNDLFRPKTIKNMGQTALWSMVNISGQPIHKSLSSNGFEITKQFYDLNGQIIDTKQVTQGDRLIVVLNGKAKTGEFQRPILVDLLPAGLELENSNLVNSDQLSRLQWIPELTPVNYSEALDDRFIAAFDIIAGKSQQFTLAYPVRAVTKGKYGVPGADIEDMYQPYFRANSDTGLMHIH